MKPLGLKNYGSIPHLPSSKLGEGDHHCDPGMARICLEKVRDKHDLIIVQEKVDGSNVGVCKVDGRILAITRSGYLATTSKYLQHIYFDRWVHENYERFDRLLKEKERVCGEWMIQAHGTRYDMPHEPFVAFDIFTPDNARVCYSELIDRTFPLSFITPDLLHQGEAIPLREIERRLELGPDGIDGFTHGALDLKEGAVWRVERKGKVDFLVKWVKRDKVNGKYFPETETFENIVWNTWKGKTREFPERICST